MKNLAKPINGGYRQHKMGNVSEVAKAIYELETKNIKSVTLENMDTEDGIVVSTKAYGEEATDIIVGKYARPSFKQMIRENLGSTMGVYLDDYYGITKPDQSSRDLTQEEALYVIVKSYADGKALELMYRDSTSNDPDYMGAGIDEIDGLIGDDNILWQAWGENCPVVDKMLIEFSESMKPEEAYAQALFDESKAIIETIDYVFDGIDAIDPIEYDINLDTYAVFKVTELAPDDIVEAAETMHKEDEETEDDEEFIEEV
ncbi:MAG: hypothetical protein ACRCX2_31695 [Paraclostridium sp.]